MLYYLSFYAAVKKKKKMKFWKMNEEIFRLTD